MAALEQLYTCLARLGVPCHDATKCLSPPVRPAHPSRPSVPPVRPARPHPAVPSTRPARGAVRGGGWGTCTFQRLIGSLGYPVFPESQVLRMVHFPVFPDSQVPRMVGPSVFPDSQVLRMLGPSVFPDSQVIPECLVLQYSQIHRSYQNAWSFSISRFTSHTRVLGPSVFPDSQAIPECLVLPYMEFSSENIACTTQI